LFGRLQNGGHAVVEVTDDNIQLLLTPVSVS